MLFIIVLLAIAAGILLLVIIADGILLLVINREIDKHHQCFYNAREDVQEETTHVELAPSDIRKIISSDIQKMNASDIKQQIKQCCCNYENASLMSRYDVTQHNYMQNIRDEINAIRLGEPQCTQNNYLISQLQTSNEHAYLMNQLYQCFYDTQEAINYAMGDRISGEIVRSCLQSIYRI